MPRRPSPRKTKSKNYLQVTGLNDNIRVDCTGQPFFSIDGLGPREIDDAMRVTRNSQSSFKLEVAIVDGSQLSPDHEQTQRAIEQRHSYYSHNRQVDNLMLAGYVIRAMELRGKRCRAMLLTQQFDADVKPVEEPTIMPAWISTVNLHISHQSQQLPEDLGYFAQRWLGRTEPVAPLNQRFCRQLVDASMTFANRTMTDWIQREGIAVPLRIPGSKSGSYKARFVGPGDVDDVSSFKQLNVNFTAPLRIAAHLITHQQVGAHIAGMEEPYSIDDINLLAPELYVEDV